jgi:hypothetical protein
LWNKNDIGAAFMLVTSDGYRLVTADGGSVTINEGNSPLCLIELLQGPEVRFEH